MKNKKSTGGIPAGKNFQGQFNLASAYRLGVIETEAKNLKSTVELLPDGKQKTSMVSYIQGLYQTAVEWAEQSFGTVATGAEA